MSTKTSGKVSDVQNSLQRWFAPIGETARANDVRLSFHPDQFVVLASDRDEVVNKSIEEFEYHCDMVRWMGYGKQFQDFKVNVHISGRRGPQGIRDVYNRLSPEARNTLTLENEEYTHGLTDCLSLSDLVPTVMDIHHNWIREGNIFNLLMTVLKWLLIVGVVFGLLYITPSAVKMYLSDIPDHSYPLMVR
jgi:UV DNA damage endonuclease